MKNMPNCKNKFATSSHMSTNSVTKVSQEQILMAHQLCSAKLVVSE